MKSKELLERYLAKKYPHLGESFLMEIKYFCQDMLLSDSRVILLPC